MRSGKPQEQLLYPNSNDMVHLQEAISNGDADSITKVFSQATLADTLLNSLQVLKKILHDPHTKPLFEQAKPSFRENDAFLDQVRQFVPDENREDKRHYELMKKLATLTAGDEKQFGQLRQYVHGKEEIKRDALIKSFDFLTDNAYWALIDRESGKFHPWIIESLGKNNLDQAIKLFGYSRVLARLIEAVVEKCFFEMVKHIPSEMNDPTISDFFLDYICNQVRKNINKNREDRDHLYDLTISLNENKSKILKHLVVPLREYGLNLVNSLGDSAHFEKLIALINLVNIVEAWPLPLTDDCTGFLKKQVELLQIHGTNALDISKIEKFEQVMVELKVLYNNIAHLPNGSTLYNESAAFLQSQRYYLYPNGISDVDLNKIRLVTEATTVYLEYKKTLDELPHSCQVRHLSMLLK